MEKIINEKNDWDQTTNGDLAAGLMQRVANTKIINSVKKIKLGKVAGLSDSSKRQN